MNSPALYEIAAQHRRDPDPCQFAELGDHPCSATEDAFLTVGTCLLALAPILIVAFFAVF